MNNKTLNTLKCDKSSCRPIEIPTEDEVKALDRLRKIKNRVRAIKKELSYMAIDSSFYNERFRAESELLQLKKEWKYWGEKRDDAARDRMIALGHLKPDQPN